jgi:uncharacterized protein
VTDPLERRLIAAFSRFDVAALEGLLAEDVRHWLNISGEERGRDEILARVAQEGQHVATATFDVRRRTETPDGFVLQVTVRGETAGGAPFSIPACLIVAVRDGKVARIDEYASVDHAMPIIREMFG